MREESLKKNWTRWKPSPETPECLLMKNKLIKKDSNKILHRY